MNKSFYEKAIYHYDSCQDKRYQSISWYGIM